MHLLVLPEDIWWHSGASTNGGEQSTACSLNACWSLRPHMLEAAGRDLCSCNQCMLSCARMMIDILSATFWSEQCHNCLC